MKYYGELSKFKSFETLGKQFYPINNGVGYGEKINDQIVEYKKKIDYKYK